MEIEKKFNLFKAINYTPIEKAIPVHKSDAQINIILAGMRSSKSSCLVPEALFEFIKPKRNIWVVGLDYSKTDRFIFGSGEVKGVLTYIREYMPFLIDTNRHIHRRDHMIENKLGSVIKGKSVKYPDSFIAEPVNLIILEDAGSFPDGFYDQFIRPRVIDTSGRIFINSVPPLKRNWLTELYEKADGKTIKRFNWTMYDNPHLPREEILKLENEIPAHLKKTIIYGQLPDEESSVFGDLEKNVRDYFSLPYEKGHIYQAGVDIGKVHDRTVLAISDLTAGCCVYIDRFPPKFFKVELVKERLLKGLEKYNFPLTYVDVSGLGEIFRSMVDEFSFFQPFVISSNKIRNTLIEGLSIAFQRGYTIPNFDFLLTELKNLEIVIRPGYHLYKTKSGYYDDCIIALALSIYGWESKIGITTDLKKRRPIAVKGEVIEDGFLKQDYEPIDLTDDFVV